LIIRIKNLRLRTIIGCHDWERKTKQDLIINIKFAFDGAKAAASDDIHDTVDYMGLKKKIIATVEDSDFNLLEKLADSLLKLIMEEPKITKAKVEIDKPYALRYADSVSVSCSAKRKA
jgi:D-erythro-7,8-dihydroneopterin triphosphate epimerase